jgi:hypothetical protein
MLSLLYKIAGDISPMRRALGDVAKEAEVTGKKAGAALSSGIKAGAGGGGGARGGAFNRDQMRSVLTRYLGAGAIIGTANLATSESAETLKGAAEAGLSPEAFQELKKAADATGLSIDELKKSASEFPVEFAKLMSSIRGGLDIVDDKTVRQLAQLDKVKGTGWSMFKSIGWQAAKAGVAFNQLSDVGMNFGLAATTHLPGFQGMGEQHLGLGVKLLKDVLGQGDFTGKGGFSYAEDYGAKVRAAMESSKDWEAMGGNVDWSGKSGVARGREELKEMKEELRTQTEIHRDNSRSLKALQTLMREQ